MTTIPGEHFSVEPFAVVGETQRLIEKIKPILAQEDNLLAWQFALSELLADVFLRLADNEQVHARSVAENGVALIVDHVQKLYAAEAARHVNPSAEKSYGGEMS